MKNSVSFTVPKPGIAKWGNFNHTNLVRAELFRAVKTDKTAVKVIEGIVRSAHDLSVLVGISVKLKGTNLEAQTDENGWFSLLIEKPSVSDVVIFTSSGFLATQLLIKDEEFLHVNLRAEELVKEKSKRWTLRSFLSI